MEFIIETPEHIIRNIHHPDKFVPDSFEVYELGMNVSLIVGQPNDQDLIQGLINPEKKIVQSVKFMKPDWDLEDAFAWLQENQKNFSTMVETKKMFAADLKSIDGVQIFSAGVWNGDEYTVGDLDQMVKAFEETSQTVRPFLKLGHSTKQALLESEGLPAAGWIGKIYREGDKLFANFIDIPNKIHELIVNKAYRKVSSEIYLGVKIKDASYKYLVGAVALLGAETPGVMNLSDILSRFGLRDYESIKSYASDKDTVTVKQYSFENENPLEDPMPKTEREIELELQLKAQKDAADVAQNEVKQFKADAKSNDDALKSEIEKREAAEKKAFDFEKSQKQTEIEAQADKMVAEKVITKGTREYAIALLKDEPETKKYSFGEGEKATELSKFELIKKFAEGLAVKSDVNLEEGSVDGDKHSNEVSTEDVEKYAEENKVSFSVAYKAVCEGKLSNGSEDKED